MDLSPYLANGVLVLAPTGRIDQAHADAFAGALDPHLSSCTAQGTPLVIDLASVAFISSVGLRVLMLAHRRVGSQGGQLAVAALTPLVREVFTISHFDQVLRVFDSVESAVTALGGAP